MKLPRKIYLAQSGIHGKGVFAKKNLKKGEIAFIMKGKIKKWVVKNLKTSLAGPNWIGIDHGIWIDPENTAFEFLNHSCNPTLGIKGKVTYVALRNIKKGEELTFDYSITEDDMLWHMKNGEKKVPGFRPVVRSIQHLPLATYKKYLPYVPKYFQKVYNEYHKLKKNG